MKVLLIGSGGREHAIGWKLATSPHVKELISLPGNPGLAELGPVVEGISTSDVGAIAAMARVHAVDLVIVGPEAPLAAGLVDALTSLGVESFGPTRAAARLESSKAFAKQTMEKAGVPTAGSRTFTDLEEARSHIEQVDPPYVVKADGLAAGKGVLVTESAADASDWARRCFDGSFGDAGNSIVIEEFLDGPEISIFCVCTESGAVPLEPARDYKRLSNGDEGPNTGGMGSYSPVTNLPEGFVEQVMSDVVEPTLAQMAEDGNPFTGFLYAGLVLTGDGPKVLEFNVRLGDPETQVVLPRLENDLIDVIQGAQPAWSTEAAVNVVLAAPGYPESPQTGGTIKGLRDVPEDVLVFHAGTARDGKRLIVDGGRALSVVGRGEDLEAARQRAYLAVEAISWPDMQIRTDIGQPSS